MIEISIGNFNYGVIPMENDAKQINVIHQPSMTVYHLPFSKEALEHLIDLLQKDNDELQKELDKRVREAKAREAGLEIAGPGQMPKENGTQSGQSPDDLLRGG